MYDGGGMIASAGDPARRDDRASPSPPSRLASYDGAGRCRPHAPAAGRAPHSFSPDVAKHPDERFVRVRLRASPRSTRPRAQIGARRGLVGSARKPRGGVLPRGRARPLRLHAQGASAAGLRGLALGRRGLGGDCACAGERMMRSTSAAEELGARRAIRSHGSHCAPLGTIDPA